jgi:AcrR family transcriptional regulator
VAPANAAPTAFELSEYLASELAAAGKLGRAEVTRRRLLIATAALLQEHGYTDLTVAGICKRAGVAHGTFYLHWRDRRDAAEAVASTFMQTIRIRRPAGRPEQGFHDRLVSGHLYYIEVYRLNAGLMRAQRQLADMMPEFAAIGLEANLGLARRVLRAAAREAGTAVAEGPERLATALACIGMVDKLLHDVFVRKLDLGMDDLALAHMFANIWYSALLRSDVS